jgi:Myb/SANT-like DNA-binding protein
MPPKSQVSRPISAESSQRGSVDLTQDTEDTKPNTTRLRWTDEMHEALLESLLTQFQAGKATDGGGFKAEAWAVVLDAIRRATRPNNGVAEELACRNKWAWFKETWKNYKILEGMSGFGWDDESELFKADIEVWEGVSKVILIIFLIYHLIANSLVVV